MEKSPSRLNLFFSIAMGKSSFYTSVRISLIVGTLLNLINQGQQLIYFEWGDVNFLKLGLTFLVPFLVSSYASSLTKLQFYVGTPAVVKALLKCRLCGNEIIINKTEPIPKCTKCNKNKRWSLKKIV